MALDIDVDLCVSGSADGTVVVHSVHKGRFVRSYRPAASGGAGHSAAVRLLSISASGYIITYTDAQVLYTHTINGLRIARAEATQRVAAIAIAQQGELGVCGGTAGYVEVYTLHDLQVQRTINLAGESPVRSLSFSPDYQYLFIGQDDGRVSLLTDPKMRLTMLSSIRLSKDKQVQRH